MIINFLLLETVICYYLNLALAYWYHFIHIVDCPIISDIDDIENVTVNGISLGQIQSVLAMDRNDIEPLCVDDSLQTVEIYVELSHLHVLTSIEFLNGTTITAFDLQYSNDPSKWTGYQDSLNKTEVSFIALTFYI